MEFELLLKTEKMKQVIGLTRGVNLKYPEDLVKITVKYTYTLGKYLVLVMYDFSGTKTFMSDYK